MADKIVSWGGIDSKGTDGMGVTGSFQVSSSANSFFVGGGNVGIGTPTPSASLHISGSSNSALLEIDSPAASNILFVSGSGRVGLGTNNPAYNLDLKNSGTTYFGVKAISSTDAWVGIGTTGYDYVKGLFLGTNYSIHFGGSTLNSLSNDGDVYSIKINGYQRAIVDGTGAKINVKGYGPPSIIFSTQPTFDGTNNSLVDRMIINNNGNVVIGTTSPSARLHVRGSGTTDSTTALLVQNANASASLAVLDDGNVGIGTTAPLVKLQVKSSITNGVGTEAIRAYGTSNYIGIHYDEGRGPVLTTNYSGVGGSSPGAFNFYTASVLLASIGTGGIYSHNINGKISSFNASGYINLWNGASGNMELVTTTNHNMTFSTNNTERIRINNSGSVGIGTTTPSASLHISGSATGNLFLVSSPTSSGMLFVSSSGTTILQPNTITQGQFNALEIRALSAVPTIQLRSNGTAVFNDNIQVPYLTGPSSRILVVSDVRFGGNFIGIPDARVHVRGSGTTSSTTALLVQNANASNMLSLTDNGALTINTFQTSSTAFTVNRTNASMGSNFNAATMGTLVSINDTVGNSNGAKTTVYINSSDASVNNAVEIYGGVGIGTAPYGNNLYVGYNTGIYNTTRIQTTTAFPLTSRDSRGLIDTTAGGGISFWGDASGQGTGQSAFAGIRGLKANSTYVNPLGNLAFYVQTGSSSHVIDETTFREVARFNELGSFGIGTSTPTATLHVSGSGRFNGDLVMSGSTQNRSVKLTDSGLYLSRTSDGGYASTITADGVMYFNTRNSYVFNNDGTTSISFQSDTRNVLIGTTSDLARLTVRGSGATTSTKTLLLQNSSNTQLGYVDDSGRWQIGPGTNSGFALEISGSAQITGASGGYKLTLKTTGGGNGAGLLVDQNGYTMLDVNAFDVYMRSYPSNTAKLDFWSWNSYGGPTNVLFAQNSQYHVSLNSPDNYKIPIVKFPDATVPIIMGNIATSAIRGYLTVGGAFYASASLGASQRIVSTVSAIANNDTLIGLDILPTFANGAYTGVTNHALRVSGSTYLYKSGSTVLDIQGSSGQLFSVTDSLSGSLFSVNTVAGLPVIEAFSNNVVNIGKYGNYNLVISGSNTTVTGSLVLNGSNMSSAWTAYTPDWTAASSNPAIGNGTIEGYYKIIGKTCFVRGNIVIGSTTTFGTGEWYVSMPFTASHADGILMTANLLDNGTAWYNAVMNGARAGFNYKAPIQYQAVGGTANDVNPTQPFAWATSDRFIWNGSYEIA
jgi:hypothetical protein